MSTWVARKPSEMETFLGSSDFILQEIYESRHAFAVQLVRHPCMAGHTTSQVTGGVNVLQYLSGYKVTYHQVSRGCSDGEVRQADRRKDTRSCE